MSDLSDKEMLDALGVSIEAKKKTSRTARAARVIAGFEEILKFAEEHGRAPEHGEDNDIFERLYAVRLDRLRVQEDCRSLLSEYDAGGLLNTIPEGATPPSNDLDDTALLSKLGVEIEPDADITKLKHVKPRAEVRAAEEIANRTKCEDFGKFEPLFRQVQSDIETGARETRPFARKSEIEEGRYFIVGGQIAVVAEKGEVYVNAQNMSEARLRVIFDNGTESNMLMRSLQRALHKDDLGRRITDPVAGPLFGGEKQEGDNESGTIYVLRSKSEHPAIAANRDVIHKIGVTGGDVKTRISSAGKQATFLLADVELVATYELYNINRKKLEKLLHRFLASARLDLEIEDRFGQRVKPQEWFVVPLTVVNEVVERLHDQTLSRYRYDRETASLVRE